jgi:hypothetical protein
MITHESHSTRDALNLSDPSNLEIQVYLGANDKFLRSVVLEPGVDYLRSHGLGFVLIAGFSAALE